MSSTIVGEFETLVLELMKKTGVGREKAESVIRANNPRAWAAAPAPRVVPRSVSADGRDAPLGGFARDPNVDEDAEQVEVEKLFRAYGAVIYRTSQKRPSKVSRGIADLIVMFPARGFGLWWETKRQVGGEQRPDQIQFEKDCRAAGWTYRLGDRFDAARYLLNLGIAEPGEGPCGILPVRAGGLPSQA